MRTLYLRIYLTVVAVLLLFALVSGWLLQRNIEQERERFQASASARLTAWSELLQNALPGADEPPGEQAQALLDWSQRLRVPLALDDAAGRRIATAPSFARVTGMPPPEPPGEPGRPGADDGPPPRPPHAGGPWHAEGARHGGPPDADGPPREPQRVRLNDGRVLWIVRPSGPRRPDGRPLFAEPPFARGAGLAIGLVLLFVAVAAGAYPVVRRLTRRLESLKQGVEAFGAGALHHRVDAGGRDEVAAVAASFNQAAARIESLVRANQSLLANASHELRSPLARLKMAVEMLESAEAPQRAPLRDEIERNIRELDTLVEEVLLASRLDVAENPLHRDKVDLLAVAAEEAARVGAHVESTRSVHVDGDERLLRRAVRNLLENAQRYGGGEVEIGLGHVTVRGRDCVFLEVCDRGPGVPEAMRERIFEPFFRLPGHAEQAGGIGLGLALVKQIAVRHGGDVRCEARSGGGSVFVIEMPA